MKLKAKFILPLSLLILAGMGIVSIVLYQTARKEIETSVIGQLEQLSETIVRSLDDYHSSSNQDVELLGQNILFSELFSQQSKQNINSINNELKRIKENKPEYENVCIADNSGNIIAATDEKLINNLNVKGRDYFQNAINGNIYSGEIGLSKVTGNPTFGTSTPIIKDGEVAGVFFVITDITYFDKKYIEPVVIGKNGYVYIVDNRGFAVTNPDRSLIMKNDFHDYDFGKTILDKKNGKMEYTFNGVVKTAVFRCSNEKNWFIIATADNVDIFEGVNKVLRVTILIICISLIIIIFIIVLLVGAVVKPIKTAVAFAELIARGDLRSSPDQKHLKRKDELGDLAKAFQEMIHKLQEVVLEVKSASFTVAQGSNQLASTAEDLSQGATEQASISEEVSSSMEEIGASIQQNTDNSLQTEKMATRTAKDAEEGGNAVMETVAAMKAIAEKVKIIDDLARNTNMLSLNASIEAARAGEHGKGFAVVATEVGKLAANSQKAAQEIFDLASLSVGKAELAGEMISRIIPDIKKTAELVQEISASSIEQNSGAAQVNQVLIQLDQVIQTNAASAEESSSMSEELSGQADRLAEIINYFKTGENREREMKSGPGRENLIKTTANRINSDRKESTGSNINKKYVLPEMKAGGDETDKDFENF